MKNDIIFLSSCYCCIENLLKRCCIEKGKFWSGRQKVHASVDVTFSLNHHWSLACVRYLYLCGILDYHMGLGPVAYRLKNAMMHKVG